MASNHRTTRDIHHRISYSHGKTIRLLLQKQTVQDEFLLPIFSTEEKLRAAMTLAAAPFESIKKIDDKHDFLSSIPEYVGNVRITDHRRSLSN